ncbi:hypothetical protein FKM82_006164 [Ascaphus truei]
MLPSVRIAARPHPKDASHDDVSGAHATQPPCVQRSTSPEKHPRRSRAASMSINDVPASRCTARQPNSGGSSAASHLSPIRAPPILSVSCYPVMSFCLPLLIGALPFKCLPVSLALC